jgi:PAS domain S-box-containing protein
MMERPSSIEEDCEDLYEDAPCGFVSVLPYGEIVRINRTLLSWTGYTAEELYAGKRFPALLTSPGALLYESYCVPLLRTRGSIGEIALDLLCRDGSRQPVLLSAVARKDAAGDPSLFRIVILNAPKRREYERELLQARAQAEDAADQLRIQREAAERKVAEQDSLLQAMGRMAEGDLETPILIEPESGLVSLARGLDRMRQNILSQIREMKERNNEIGRLDAELLHQIEQRSRVLLEAMQAAMDDGASLRDSTSPGKAHPLLAGGTVLANRYRVEGVLGRGAMGIVYEVERISDGRRFAAKVLSARPDHRAMARFAREALLLARLRHPNLIAIVDLDVTPERVAYMVMELVYGASLAELRARYRDREFMVQVLQQIADALTTVHAAGVVHRDLKPGNVLISVSADGTRPTARLADFGISRLLDIVQGAPDNSAPERVEITMRSLEARSGRSDETIADPTQAAAMLAASAQKRPDVTLDVVGRAVDLTPPTEESTVVLAKKPAAAPDGLKPPSRPSDGVTQIGALVGTPLYMAPELAKGTNLAQPPSDIFSFGIMAYEVLTGTLPFEEPPLVLLARPDGALHVKPLGARCPGLSPSLARLLERCLDVNPELRPKASELSVALGKIPSTNIKSR